jgi:UDP-N-acetylglucosamine diphosphorylase / glucose-1-phosphate thymidylyltransferase / UDP-N-acetylgalactosamine diphosphorylase / glucosamine-1-phosphate N-acetyltransferase / galactosamine-1-phosphate N-acetyltransferase
MSKKLLLSSFLDLPQILRDNVFDGNDFAWLALTKIKNFLDNQKLGVIEVDVPSSVILVNPSLISIGKGTVIEPGSYIKGPCVIGENCCVRFGSYIRGNVIICNGCVVGHATEVKHSILMDNVAAAHFAYIGDTVVGNNVNLGAGVKCANFRLDKNEIFIKDGGDKIETGLKKMGAIIGDNSQIGCNCVINPGTLIYKNSSSFPNNNISGIVSEGSVIRGLLV